MHAARHIGVFTIMSDAGRRATQSGIFRETYTNNNELETQPMASIQNITISNLTSDTLRVEITVADRPEPESATVFVAATLPVERRGHSLESIEAATIDTLIDILRKAVPADVKQRMRVVY